MSNQVIERKPNGQFAKGVRAPVIDYYENVGQLFAHYMKELPILPLRTAVLCSWQLRRPPPATTDACPPDPSPTDDLFVFGRQIRYLPTLRTSVPTWRAP
jgi:hypothetical protein